MVITFAAISPGETGVAERPASILRQIPKDQVRVFTAPLKMSRTTWLKTALPIAGITASLVLTDTRIVKALPNTQDQTRISSAVSEIGSLYTLGAGVAGVTLVGKLSGDSESNSHGCPGHPILN